MVKIITFFVLMSAAAFADFQPKDYLWKNRLIVIYAPTADEPKLGQQRDSLNKQAAAVKERHLRIFTWENARTLPEVARTRYEIDPARFTVLLIGKDGGVKLRSGAVVPPERFFQLIDSMPMRQAEMQRP